MPHRGSFRSGRTLAVAAFVVSALAALLGPIACSLIVTDNMPPFFCTPDAAQACPSDQHCVPNGAGTQYVCEPICHVDRDCLMGTCDSKGWCVTVNEGGAGDGGLVSDATMSDVAADVSQDGRVVDSTLGDSPLDAPLDRMNAPDREAAAPDVAVGDAEAGSTDGSAVCSGFGCRCSTDTECPTGYACVGKQAITSNIWDAWVGSGGDTNATGFCAEPCCTSNDCDMSDGGTGTTVCFPTGSGGNYCVPPAWLGDRGPIGPSSNSGGAACSPDSGACRSGLCVASMCQDTCCSNYAMNECATGSVCRFSAFPGTAFDTHEAAHCSASSGNPGNTGGMQCNMNTDCRSNLCIINPDAGGFGGPSGNCRDACRVPDECAGTGGIRSPTGSCEYAQPFAGSTDIATICLPIGQGGGGLVRGDAGSGAACTSTADCARGYCAAGHCLVVCYVDVTGSSGDCFAGERCRPQPLVVVDGGATYSVLACGM